jgi:hypothetical protein
MVVSLVVGFTTGYGMAHALGIPSALGASLGGVIGIVSAFIIAENTPKQPMIAQLWMPFPASAALTLGAWLHPSLNRHQPTAGLLRTSLIRRPNGQGFRPRSTMSRYGLVAAALRGCSGNALTIASTWSAVTSERTIPSRRARS